MIDRDLLRWARDPATLAEDATLARIVGEMAAGSLDAATDQVPHDTATPFNPQEEPADA